MTILGRGNVGFEVEQYYAFVEKCEVVEEGYELLLDAVRAERIDAISSRFEEVELEELITFVLAFRLSRRNYRSHFRSLPAHDLESKWVAIEITGTELPQIVFRFDESEETVQRYLLGLRLLDSRNPDDRARKNALKAKCDLAVVGKTTKRPKPLDLLRIVGPVIESVTVYDVGQGNALALCDPRGVPQIYFDLGGGCYLNRRTYPYQRRFCTTTKPTVVLSHWDSDHYYSALRSSDLQKLVWIVPSQRIGPRAAKFASAVAKNGELHVWTAQGSIVVGSITLIRCIGRNRNNSGIALLVQFKHLDTKASILLPGDAVFRNIPMVSTQAFTGLVASHHGGDIGSRASIPHTRNGLIAYSFGRGNTYHHPSQRMQGEYVARGWSSCLQTPNGSIIMERRNNNPSLACGGRHCDLTITQHF